MTTANTMVVNRNKVVKTAKEVNSTSEIQVIKNANVLHVYI